MTYRLVRSPKRRRSLALSVSSDGCIVVRAPLWTPKFLIDRFVKSRADWIRKQRSIHYTPITKPKRHFSDTELKELIHHQVTHYSQLLNLTPTAVRFKTVKSYWGNCSPKGVLTFNLQLAFAPEDAVTYVVVHELAHLRYRGHGMRFWDLVNRTYPAANTMRAVLRRLRLSH